MKSVIFKHCTASRIPLQLSFADLFIRKMKASTKCCRTLKNCKKRSEDPPAKIQDLLHLDLKKKFHYQLFQALCFYEKFTYRVSKQVWNRINTEQYYIPKLVNQAFGHFELWNITRYPNLLRHPVELCNLIYVFEHKNELFSVMHEFSFASKISAPAPAQKSFLDFHLQFASSSSLRRDEFLSSFSLSFQ